MQAKNISLATLVMVDGCAHSPLMDIACTVFSGMQKE